MTEYPRYTDTSRVLVTGGAGFLGRHLVQKLLNNGHHVTVLDNLCTGELGWLAQFQHEPLLEIVNTDVTIPLPDSIRASRIYHLACPASPEQFSIRPTEILHTCYQGTKNVLEAGLRWRARVLLASTSEVYGNAERCPQDEAYHGNVNCFGPRACYDEGKRVAEALAYSYREQHGADVRIARIFNVYGPGMSAKDGRVVCNFIDAALNGRDMVIYGDGTATRCFQYVDDCISGLSLLMKTNTDHGPINIGSEHETTIAELAEMISSAVARQCHGIPPTRIVHAEAKVDDPWRRKPDCRAARRNLGWEPHVLLEDGISRTVEWFMQTGSVDMELDRDR